MKLITDEDDLDNRLREDAENSLRLIMTSVHQVAPTARRADRTDEQVDDHIVKVIEQMLSALGLPRHTDCPVGPWIDELKP